jgi:hypothetical protein
MTKTKGDTALESVNTKIRVLTPALHDGRKGAPIIIEIGSNRFASNVPTDPEHAQELNNTIAAMGGKL